MLKWIILRNEVLEDEQQHHEGSWEGDFSWEILEINVEGGQEQKDLSLIEFTRLDSHVRRFLNSVWGSVSFVSAHHTLSIMRWTNDKWSCSDWCVGCRMTYKMTICQIRVLSYVFCVISPPKHFLEFLACAGTDLGRIMTVILAWLILSV